MTFKERYDKDYPNKPGPIGCPWNYGYEVMPDHGCSPDAFENGVCKKCWSREIPHSIKDSGDRTQFKTGAVRDMRTGKGRFDLVPLAVLFNYFDLTGKDDKVLYNIYSFQQTKYADVDRLFWALEGFCHAAYNSCAPTMFLEVLLSMVKTTGRRAFLLISTSILLSGIT